MEAEIRRRLNILNEIGVAPLTAMQLRGDMQSRLHRQELVRHRGEVIKLKKKLKTKLSLIEQQKQEELGDGFGVFSSQAIEPLDDFDEPLFRRVRSRRGFLLE